MLQILAGSVLILSLTACGVMPKAPPALTSSAASGANAEANSSSDKTATESVAVESRTSTDSGMSPSPSAAQSPGVQTPTPASAAQSPAVLTDFENKAGVTVSKTSVLSARSKAPVKGESIFIKADLVNRTSKATKVKLRVHLSSKAVEQLQDVVVGSQDIALAAGESKSITYKVDSIISDMDRKKEFALAHGGYSLAFSAILSTGETIKEAASKENRFDIDESNVVFTAVLWKQTYLDKIKYKGSVDAWLKETFTRKAEIYNPDTRSYTSYPGGFDQMMGIRTVFKTYEGFTFLNDDPLPFVNAIAVYAMKRLGLRVAWENPGGDNLNSPINNGFDFVVGMSPDAKGLGGSAWGGGNLAGAMIFDGSTDPGIGQMVLIHEVAHAYGAPHCEGVHGVYTVMCGGEGGAHYISDKIFVWEQSSFDLMKKGREGFNRLPSDSKFTQTSPEVFVP